MGELLILGAGQYGIVAKEVAEAMETFSRVSFLDDHSERAVGKLSDIEKMEYEVAFVAIGNPSVRAEWLQKIAKVATLIHPKAMISPSAKIGEGSIVEAGAVISAGAKVGNGVFIMANAVVGHNATVGDYCQLKYGCVIVENCNVPNDTKIDCNTVYSDLSIMQ